MADAEAQIQRLADDQWKFISSTESKSKILDFLRAYPETSKKAEAESKIAFIADSKWAVVSETTSKEVVRQFLKDYPETTKHSEAEKRIIEIADLHWRRIASTRSVEAIRAFLKEHPETSMQDAAESRIQALYDDWEWVREQDSIESYQRFLTRNPGHHERNWIEKRIIDLEVKQIAAGEFGEMPRAQPLSLGGTTIDVEIENQTGFELTVRYSGPESKKIIIATGATRSISLTPGDYKIAASVTAAHVRNYYGTDNMRGGRYSSRFYIQSSNESFSTPEFRPRRR